MLSIQGMVGVGHFRPEENWQCIDLDLFYIVSYGKCFTVLPPERLCATEHIYDSK